MGKKNTDKSSPGKSKGKAEDHAPAPVVIAGVDVGATSVRMAVAQVGPAGELELLEELVHPVALGLDTFRLGQVTAKTTRALCQVLANFQRKLGEYGAIDCRAVATSAVRDAANQDVLIDRIRHETGLTLEVLDPVEETRFTYQYLLPRLDPELLAPAKHTLIVDLGGGSTEYMVLRGGNLVFVGSRRLGTSRLFHGMGGADCGDSHLLLESVIRNVVGSTLDLCRAYSLSECVIINAQLRRALSKRPGVREVAGGLFVPVETLHACLAEAQKLSAEELCARFEVGRGEAELLLPALLVVESFLENVRAERVLLSEVDLLGGILHDMALRRTGQDPERAFHKQVVGSALGVAKKFQFDREHSLQVAKLALQIFDQIAGFLDLSGHDRLLLEVAAILHDIGMYISEQAHHKHSAYLVRWAEIVGLPLEQRILASHIARYHRKSHPRPQHIEFFALPAVDRLRVIKLAAILRVGDALDRSHRQPVSRLRLELGEDELVIHARANEELAVENVALREKGRLFEEVTGRAVTLRRTI